MRILFLVDLHGSTPELPDSDVIVVAGDFCDFSGLRGVIFSAWKRGRKDWWNVVEKHDLDRMIERIVETGRKSAEHVLSSGKPVYAIPGNTDFFWERPGIKPQYYDIIKGIHDFQGNKIEIGGRSFVGYGGTWGPEDEIKDAKILELMGEVEKLMLLIL